MQPCWCSQNIPCPGSLSDTDGMKASPVHALSQMGWKLHPPFHSQHRLTTTSPALFSMRQIIMSDFKLCYPGIMKRYPSVLWYECAFPFYSQQILIWIQNMDPFCFNSKERLQEVEVIFGDLYLIFLCKSTNDVCIHQVILCDIYPPAKPDVGQGSCCQLSWE